jgi:hypothetical protein
MSFTLGELIEDVYAELGQLQVSTATGGTSTTLVDEKMKGSGSDKDWKDGTLLMLDADGEAPEGEFSTIAEYQDNNGTFTLRTGFSAAPEDGDCYGLVSAQYPVGVMLRLINHGLRTLGDIPLVDNTTLQTVSGQSEYPVEASWKRRPPYRIDLQVNIDETGLRWQRIYDWEYIPSAAGEAGRIVFQQQLPDGRPLRVWYQGPHKPVKHFNDPIAEVIAPSLAVAACVEQGLRWQNSRLGGGDSFMLQRWNDAKRTLEHARLLHPIWRPKRSSQIRLAGIGGQG